MKRLNDLHNATINYNVAYDEETGVEYIVLSYGPSISITPRLDKFGKPLNYFDVNQQIYILFYMLYCFDIIKIMLNYYNYLA